MWRRLPCFPRGRTAKARRGRILFGGWNDNQNKLKDLEEIG